MVQPAQMDNTALPNFHPPPLRAKILTTALFDPKQLHLAKHQLQFWLHFNNWPLWAAHSLSLHQQWYFCA